MKTATELQVKLNDVYNFRFNEKELGKRFMPYHCFDGTLIVRKRDNGDFYFQDTYWGCNDSKTFTIKQASEQGSLTFICNLDEVEKCREDDKLYYDDADFITLHIHANYSNAYYLKKGAIRSKEKMIESVNENLIACSSLILSNGVRGSTISVSPSRTLTIAAMFV